MQAFGGLFLEKTAEGGLRSASRDWSVVADPDGCISSVTVCMFCRSETATILAAVNGIQFSLFILSKIRGYGECHCTVDCANSQKCRGVGDP